MLKRVLLYAALLLTAACASRERKPAGLLSRDEMVKTLAEIYIAEDKVNHLALTNDSGQQIFKAMLPKVMAKAGTSDSLFRLSYDYYTDHPREMEEIYTALVDSLNLREQRVSQRPIVENQ